MRRRLTHVRWPLLASAGLLVVAVLIGWLLRGGTGAVAAAAGVALVTVTYLASHAALAWADSVDPKLVLPVGLVTYATKIGLLGVVLLNLAGTGWAGVTPMAVAMLAAIVVWLTGQVWWTARERIPYVEVDPR